MKWISLAVVFCSVRCLAGATTQPLSAHAPQVWEYVGDLGEHRIPIGMTLRFGSDGKTVGGCYFYNKYCKDIRIDGEINGRAISIREFDDTGKQSGRFEGEFVRSDPRHGFAGHDDLDAEVIVGHWLNGSKSLPFYLSCTYIGSWGPGDRYAVAGFDEEKIVDRFMSRFRQRTEGGQKPFSRFLSDLRSSWEKRLMTPFRWSPFRSSHSGKLKIVRLGVGR